MNLDPKCTVPGYPNLVKALAEDDELRTKFFKACLAKLGLIVSQEISSVPSLSRLHLSSLHHSLVPELLSSWEDIITKEDGEEYIKGENDTFHLEKHDSRWSLNSLVKSLPLPGIPGASEANKADRVDGVGSDDRIVDYNAITKRLIPHEADWPGAKETPYFNHHSFYGNLKRISRRKRARQKVLANTSCTERLSPVPTRCWRSKLLPLPCQNPC